MLFSAAVVCAILFPVFAPPPLIDPRVIAMHRDIGKAAVWKGNLPFLLVSWFYHGNLRNARDFTSYFGGYVRRRRVMTGATQGGWEHVLPDLVDPLKQIRSLPPGMPVPDDVPHERLVIVSLRHAEHWETRYYDRERRPAPMQTLAALVGMIKTEDSQIPGSQTLRFKNCRAEESANLGNEIRLVVPRRLLHQFPHVHDVLG